MPTVSTSPIDHGFRGGTDDDATIKSSAGCVVRTRGRPERAPVLPLQTRGTLNRGYASRQQEWRLTRDH